MLRTSATRSTFGVHRGAGRLQRSEHVSDPGELVLVRGRLPQCVQRLREVIGSTLDVIPTSGCVGGGKGTWGLRDAHRIVERGALRVRVDDPRSPSCPGRRATTGRPDDQHDHTDDYQGTYENP